MSVSSPPDSTDLSNMIERVLADDLSATETLMASIDGILQDRLPRRDTRLVDVSDVLQETRLKVWQRLDQFSGRTAAEFRVWVQRIAENTHIDAGRYRRRACRDACRQHSLPQDSRGNEVLRSTDPSPSQRVADREQSRRLEDFLSTLSRDDRIVVQSRFLDFEDWEQISRKLDRSVAATRRLYYRAMSRCRAYFDGGAEM